MSTTERIRVGDRVTIYPRGAKKIWVADFWQDGMHKKQSLKTSNKKVAVERATQLAAELIGGTYRGAPPPVLVTRAVADYIACLETERRARRTVVKYRGVFDLFAAHLAQHKVTQLAHVTAAHVDRFRAERSRVMHAKTVYCEGVIVKQLFKWARSRKLIAENPLTDIKLNKPPLEPKPAPSFKEVNKLLGTATEPMRAQLAVLALTGMRSGELQRLRPEDVDLAGGWIHIRSRAGAETKTRESRKVPIHPRLRAVLEALPRRSRPWLFTAAPSAQSPAGDNQFSTKRLSDQFRRLVSSLGLPVGRANGYVVHSLRHFFETFAVNAGIPQRAVDTWLGHRSDRSMGAVYYRLSDEDSRAFMSKVPFGTTDAPSDTITEGTK
jgi:integrase